MRYCNSGAVVGWSGWHSPHAAIGRPQLAPESMLLVALEVAAAGSLEGNGFMGEVAEQAVNS